MAAAVGDDRRALDVSGAAGATVVHVVGVTIRNAVARGGPAIYVRDGAELHTRDVALVDNVAVGAEGGAMLVVGEGTSADLEDTVVEGNETADAGWPGGGISVVAGASLRMVGGRIAGNATKAWGGAIRGFDVRSIELDGTVVDGNRVAAGGAGGGGIFIENPGGARGTVTLTNTTFSNNLSEGNLGGGAVTLRNNLDVTIVGSTFSDNETAGTTDGGALNLSADLDVTVSGSTISGNTAFRGGGLVATGVSVAFDDTRVEGNVGEERGGGLFFWGTTVAEMEGGTVRGNSADVFGGAGIWVQDEATLRLTGTSIAENAVTGGAAGGGIWLGGSATVVATDVELRDNVAAAAGGAYMSGTATHMTFKNVMIEGNQATVYSGGGVFADGSSTLSIVGGTVSGNTAAESGGGVFALGSVAFDVTESRIADNTAGVAGGGLWVRGTTTLEDVFVTGNEAGTNGGALSAGGTTSIQGSTLAGNSAGNRGGAIFFVEGAGGPLLLVNTTLSGNDAVLGGGLGSFGSAELTHVTVLGNQASDGGGGIHLHQITPDRTITLTNTLLAANGGPSGAENCAITAAGGTIASAGGNLADDGTCAALTQATDQTDTDAGLDPELLDNGGPTPTHALLDGSAAIDAGVAAGVDIDQRGFARTGTPDVGAVEAGAEG
jgi:predicted outer membrane repeat protein